MNNIIILLSLLLILIALAVLVFNYLKNGPGYILIKSKLILEGKTRLLFIEKKKTDDFIDYVKRHFKGMPVGERLLGKYNQKRKFPDMRDFRLGPHMIDKIPLDWIIFLTNEKIIKNSRLIGHSMLTRIYWDHAPETIPDGWQGSVRRSYEDSVVNLKEPNTLVGMFVQIEQDSQKQGWASSIIAEMISFGKKRGLSSLIIPLRLPQRYELEYAEMPYEEFAFLKRQDGQYKDYWLRLHVRIGASIIGVNTISHQHVMSLKDFYQQVDKKVFTKNGYQLVNFLNEWYQVYVDLDRELALINQGCVWIKHSLT